jgi:hypothetical protein
LTDASGGSPRARGRLPLDPRLNKTPYKNHCFFPGVFEKTVFYIIIKKFDKGKK